MIRFIDTAILQRSLFSYFKRPVFFLICMVYGVLILTEVIQFHLWSQVEDLRDANLLLLLLSGHPHFLRALLVSPVYLLSDVFHVSADYLFGLLCGGMIVVMSIKLSDVFFMVGGKHLSTISVLFLMMFLFLSLFMHGRIVFSLLAMSMLLQMLVNLHVVREYSSLMGIAIRVICVFFLASVSSGTLSVIYMFFVVWFLAIQAQVLSRMAINKQEARMLIVLFVLLVATLPLLIVLLEKNMSFYGDFWTMLHHGAGKLFNMLSIEVLGLLVLIVFISSLIVGLLFVRFLRFRSLILAVCLGAVGGLFGYSTMTMAMPAMSVFVMLGVSRMLQYLMSSERRKFGCC